VTSVKFVNNNASNCLGGGAIHNEGGTLTVNKYRFSGNTTGGGKGGAIRSTGSANIFNSKFTNNSASGGYGGAIANTNGGTMTVANGTFSQNMAYSGGALYNGSSSSLTVSYSSFTASTTSTYGYGGAIANHAGTLNIKNSSFTGSRAMDGGAIYNDTGSVNLTNSTIISGNAWWEGGAVNNYSGPLVVTNSTLTQNYAKDGGGIYTDKTGTVNVTNSTIWANSRNVLGSGGGIYTDVDIYSGDPSNVALRNTIVANNTFASSLDDCTGKVTADSYNLDSDGSCDSATQKSVSDISLGPPRDNGGPTLTLRPDAGSPALNTADNAVCAAAVGSPTYGAGGKDQRGVTRPQGATCDKGAYEVRAK
jgi:predicted outer membrane repeat protein